MFAVGFLDDETYQAAIAERPVLRPPPDRSDFLAATWFSEEVRRHLFQRLGGDTVLKGEVPSLMRRPAGCEFHTRCPHAKDECRKARPEARPLHNGHTHRCHYPLGIA